MRQQRLPQRPPGGLIRGPRSRLDGRPRVLKAKLPHPASGLFVAELFQRLPRETISPALPCCPWLRPCHRPHAIGKADNSIEEFIQPRLRMVGPTSASTGRLLHTPVAGDDGQPSRSRVVPYQLLQQVIGFGVVDRKSYVNPLEHKLAGAILRGLSRVKDDASAIAQPLI